VTEEEGSAERYVKRVERFRELGRSTALHRFWWLAHNVIAHPGIGIFPSRITFKFHDYTSKKINAL